MMSEEFNFNFGFNVEIVEIWETKKWVILVVEYEIERSVKVLPNSPKYSVRKGFNVEIVVNSRDKNDEWGSGVTRVFDLAIIGDVTTPMKIMIVTTIN